MSKKIIITGKKNIDKFNKKKSKREIIKKWNLDDNHYQHENQLSYIEYLCENGEITHKKSIYENTSEINKNTQQTSNTIGKIYKIIQSEIKSKINGYKQQDIDKNIIDNDKFITYNKTLELIRDSKLICYYCQKEQFVLYKNVRQMDQWSLDRIDNFKGHNFDNVVISCLKCNLQRKRQDDEKFKFTKQMKLIKKDCDDLDISS